MKREDITYAIVGIVAGLVIGFFAANSLPKSPAATAPTAPTSGAAQTPAGDLPPGHPPISGSETTPAPPLPEGAGGSASAAGTAPELPSLEALPAASKEKRAEQEYKNIQVLKGIPADRVQKIMFAIKDSLGVECTYCHIKDQFEKDDKTAKQTARKMIRRVRQINEDGLGGNVSCYTCHRGQTRPPE